MSEEILTQQSENTTPQGSINIYPFMRKLFFGILIVIFLAVILYLVYHNGKSIYDNGI